VFVPGVRRVTQGQAAARMGKRPHVQANGHCSPHRWGKSIIAPLQYDGMMDSTLFEAWFETRLLPSLPENTVIVMDNASFHRKSKLFHWAEHAGFCLVFLPPILLSSIPLNTFGLGLNVISAKFCRFILRLISLCTLILVFVDYISSSSKNNSKNNESD